MRRSSLLIVSAVIAMGIAPGVGASAKAPSGPSFVVDQSQIDTVAAYAKKAQALADEWYPKIVKILDAGKAEAPKKITIVVDMGMDGPAATGGSEIHISARYVQQHPDDLGMIVHELSHVVQSYPKYDPVWLVEGIADYVRFFNYEPVSQRPHPDPARASCRDSYRTTAAFLDWAQSKYDRNLVQKLSQALHAGTYTQDMFKTLTGKDLDQLNTEWLASLPQPK